MILTITVFTRHAENQGKSQMKMLC